MSKYYTNPLSYIFGMKIFMLSSEYREIKRRSDALAGVFRKVIQDKINDITKNFEKGTGSCKDILHSLIEDRIKHDNDPKKCLSDTEIIDEFFTFFFGAKDTTGSLLASLTWLFHD